MSNLHLAHDNSKQAINCTRVPRNRRTPILPAYFPHTFIVVENAIYAFTDKFCKAYSGGFWEFYELSNGGFYMSSDLKGLVDVEVPSNGYRGKMTADALGITVCLFVYCYMAEDHPESNFGDLYWKLRNFAYEHKEASEILCAID